jgi:hypothetical protein
MVELLKLNRIHLNSKGNFFFKLFKKFCRSLQKVFRKKIFLQKILKSRTLFMALNIILTINFNPYSTGDPKPLLPEIFKIPYQVDIFYMIFWKRDVEWRWKLSLLEIFIRFFSKMFFTKCKKNVIFLQRICAITMLKSLIYILKMVYSVSSQLNYVYYTSCEKAL